MKRRDSSEVRHEIETAIVELFGAERRLRGRDQQARHITTAQLRALFALELAESATTGQMAKTASLNPASMTTMVDNLVENGIVVRHADPGDRRVTLVSLTDAGRAIVSERRVQWDALWEKHFGDFSARDLELALRVVQAMTDQLEEL